MDLVLLVDMHHADAKGKSFDKLFPLWFFRDCCMSEATQVALGFSSQFLDHVSHFSQYSSIGVVDANNFLEFSHKKYIVNKLQSLN